MSGADFLALATTIALALLSLALLLTFVRLLRGPTLPDRVLALDMLTTIAIGYVGVFAIKTGFTLYIDIAVAVALAGFLATLAFARYVLSRKAGEETVAVDEGNSR
jgi:multicomponent Na+:H+ antiporter subunit F